MAVQSTEKPGNPPKRSDRRRWRATAMCFPVALMLALSACNGGSSPSGNDLRQTTKLSTVADLGERIFKDVSLSVSGRMSCATCHSPDNAYAGADGRAVPLGGANLDQPGFRNAPSLRYLSFSPGFSFANDGTPTGGFNRDGRAADLSQQARRPFMAAHEMANPGAGDVIDKLRRATYADDFKRVFGADIFNRPDDAFDRVTLALAQYQKDDPDFHPFDSKYDFFLAGRVKLTDQELRGLALFNATEKGNCAACHPSVKSRDGSPPLFTDFTYDNIGVPRNREIPATADATYFDMGICGPDRQDLTARQDLCGAFKVPTLRNIDKTAPYFHNGHFNTLKEVLGFYVRRDTNPEEWYPKNPDGSVRKFDDLPIQLRGNVNISEGPYNRRPGMSPALSEPEIDDVIAFLKTLTDGYKP